MHQFANIWGLQIITLSRHYPLPPKVKWPSGAIFVQMIKQLSREQTDVALALLQYRNLPVADAGCEYYLAHLLFNRSLHTRIPTFSATTNSYSVRLTCNSGEIDRSSEMITSDQSTRYSVITSAMQCRACPQWTLDTRGK